MQLTRFTDLSLRLLLYLASRKEPLSESVTVRAASELFNVPYAHLVKVAHQLSRSGLVIGARGKGGGLRLSRDPSTIRIGDVIQQMEPKGSVIDCWTQPCPLRVSCRLRDALDAAQAAFFQELNRYTLADVADMPHLRELVQISA